MPFAAKVFFVAELERKFGQDHKAVEGNAVNQLVRGFPTAVNGEAVIKCAPIKYKL